MWLYSPLPRLLPAALRDLQDGSAAVRLSAVRDLERFVDVPERTNVLHALTKALEDPSPPVRATAARLLGDVQEPALVARLLVAMEDSDAYVRQMVIQALGTLGNPSAVSRLRRALTDERADVRFQSILALPKLVPDEAEHVWISAVSDPDALVRYIALRSLEGHLERCAETGFPAPIRAVAVRALEDDDVAVRCAAALLLAQQRDLAGAAILLAIVNGALRPREAEDEVAALEMAADLSLQAAVPGLEKRAFGSERYFRETFSLVARISLARLGHDKARRTLLRDLRAWSYARRTVAVIAVGRARLHEARPLLLAMKEQRVSADPHAISTALDALE